MSNQDQNKFLIDYTKFESTNRHFKYLLVVIDAYSRVAYAEALKNKDAITVTVAFETILNDSGARPQILSSDNGSEFIGFEFKTMLVLIE